MSDATYIEIPPQPARPKSFWRGWRGVVLALFLLAALLAGCFSWWLSQGKISSVYGRVDTVVFTVEPEYTARVEELLVRQGQTIVIGQPLARIDANPAAPAPPPQQTPQNQQNRIGSASDIAQRLNAAQETERRMSTRAAQARNEEEARERIHQQSVTEHVRALLAMRSANPAYIGAYEEAARHEAEARARMDAARDEFEKVSKMRAATDLELARIRADIFRLKQRARPGETSASVQQPVPAKTAPAPASLYAPVGGKLIGINAQIGQKVEKGRPAFLILPDGPNDRWIQAWFPMSARDKLKLGQKVSIKSGVLHFAGSVSAISAEAQELPPDASKRGARFLPVRIQPDNPKEFEELAPGANVECQIQTRYAPGGGFF